MTIVMAAQFYARYEPPSLEVSKVDAKASEETQAQETSKKRKRDGKELPHPTTHANTTAQKSTQRELEKHGPGADPPTSERATHDKSSAGLKVRKKKSQKQNKEHASATTKHKNGTNATETKAPAPSDDSEAEQRHARIHSKYKKSIKIAKIAKAAGEDAAAGHANHKLTPEPIDLHGLEPLPQPSPIPDDTPISRISALPAWLAKPVQASLSASTPFEDVHLDATMIQNLEASGYKNAFAIQSAVLPLLLPGPEQHAGDLCISAATGSGKTLAYALPIVQDLRNKPVTKLRGLIIVPTRELVAQARDVLQTCSSGTNLKVGTAIGNKTISEEQALLMERDYKYDPKAYQDRQDWLDSSCPGCDDWDYEYEYDERDMEIPTGFVVDYRSKVDILICTPGRLIDHMKSTKGFTLDHVQWLVVDEADRLLDQSFQQWVEIVIPALEIQLKPHPLALRLNTSYSIIRPRLVRKVILSATIQKNVSKLLALKLSKPVLVVLESRGHSQIERSSTDTARAEEQETLVGLPSTLGESAVQVKQAEEKPLYLLQLLEERFRADSSQTTSRSQQKLTNLDSNSVSSSESDTESEDSSSDSTSSDDLSFSSSETSPTRSLSSKSQSSYGALIFTNTNESALRLARLLSLLRPSWALLISPLTKSNASASKKTLSAFRKRKISIIVASDRASRGLDLPNLAQVINYDMPTSLTNYVHRIGRTARAGKEGIATTLVSHHEGKWFWAEIGRSRRVHRSQKVSKIIWQASMIPKEDRNAYEVALKQLGQEARGNRI